MRASLCRLSLIAVRAQKPYSAIEHLASSGSPFGYDGVLMAVIAAYFDDSGTHSESDVAVASCYVGIVDQWKKLEGDWQDARNAEGFSVFGMADILGGNGEFRNWPEEKRGRLIRRLITMMQLRSRIGFSFAVVKSDYDSIMTDQLKNRVGRFHYSLQCELA